jgi:2-amino-4-hydroxy-6-hydroxymethyldihydropteridine diphosphokinase
MSVPHWWPAYIGIGSNLESPEDQVRQAIAALGDLPRCVLVSASGLYRSAPMGPPDQPDFVNAVAAILTQTNARDLLQQLQEIERRQGRDRSVERWGPRTLDLDLLAYGAEIINEGDLIVPHPGIADRNFVLLPWQEIAPNYRVPGRTDVAAMAASISVSEPRIERIGQ